MSMVPGEGLSVEALLPASVVLMGDLRSGSGIATTVAPVPILRARVVTGRGPGTRDLTGGHPGASGRAARQGWPHDPGAHAAARRGIRVAQFRAPHRG